MRTKPFKCLISSICLPEKSAALKFNLFYKELNFAIVTPLLKLVFRYVFFIKNRAFKWCLLILSSLIILEIIDIEVGIPILFGYIHIYILIYIYIYP